ncbi:hypothetical protein JOB18_049152 [Solea senegalensis]|uniref:Uncharacterized protein n=1 Tax=Solea senegalensis TaxID=28829 RepID=A0AAV6PZB8_SOLSE|nr:hypothetical protein JOB18_049152 [Solea senegalensis]
MRAVDGRLRHSSSIHVYVAPQKRQKSQRAASDLWRLPASENQRPHSKPNRATSVDYKAALSGAPWRRSEVNTGRENGRVRKWEERQKGRGRRRASPIPEIHLNLCANKSQRFPWRRRGHSLQSGHGVDTVWTRRGRLCHLH